VYGGVLTLLHISWTCFSHLLTCIEEIYKCEQDSGLCVADFEFFYNQLVSVNAFFERIGRMYGSRMALQCSNRIGLKTMQIPRVQLLMVFYWLREKPKIRILGEKFGVSASIAMHELKNLLPKIDCCHTWVHLLATWEPAFMDGCNWLYRMYRPSTYTCSSKTD
jgi:hypothetical protein